MLRKILLEVTPPGAHGIPTCAGGTGLSSDFSSALAHASFSFLSVVQTPTETLSSPAQSAQPAFFSHNTSILVIDDSPTIRKILETCLRREGFHVISFEDGIAAMQWLLQPSTTLPALIFLDVDLPKMNGYDIARFIRKKPALKNILLIMLTKYDGVIDRLKGRLAGAQAYLSKPFTTVTITTVVQSYLGVLAAR